MPVYVDNAQIPLGRMKMSHMFADTREELEAMVREIALPKSATIQSEGQPNEHYDLSATYRAKALHAGAIGVDSRALVALIRRKRAEAANPPKAAPEPSEWPTEDDENEIEAPDGQQEDDSDDENEDYAQ